MPRAEDEPPMTGATPSRVAVGLVVVGLLGLGVGWILFPESNLLGGLALVFAPMFWIGAVVLLVVGLRGLLVAVARRRRM